MSGGRRHAAAGGGVPAADASGLPPFVPPPEPPGRTVAEVVPWHAPLAHPVFLPAAVPEAVDDPGAPAPPPLRNDRWAPVGDHGSGDVPDAVEILPESVHREGAPEAIPEAMDEAMASIHEVLMELRQYAGVAATGDAARARWFSARGPDGTVQRVDGTVRADAEAAARHLERLAQRVRAGALPLLEVEEPLREASALVLTLAALHGARSPRSA